jgi:cyclic lactone autoinducer peptide
MKKSSSITKSAGNILANVALHTAKRASTQFSYIFYQDEVPEKVKDLKKVK